MNPCPDCDRTFDTPAGLARHRTRSHGEKLLSVLTDDGPEPVDDASPFAEPSEPPDLDPPAAATSGVVEERRPQAPQNGARTAKGMFARLRGDKPTDGGPATPAGTGERTPKAPKPRRVSTQAFWGDAVEGSANLFARAGYVPMSRAMVWSSPVAGEIVEDATKGTLIDKGVQPLVRNAEKWQDLFDLIGFWGAIGLAQAQPEKAPMALMFARKRLVNLLPKIAANIAKQRKKEKAAAEAIATLMPDLEELGLGDASDPVGALIEMLFGAPEGYAAPQSESEPAPA